MVPAKECSQTCQQFSAWNPPNLDHMSHSQLEQNSSLQCLPPATFTANVAFPGKYTSDLLGLDTVLQDAVAGSFKLLPQCGNVPYSTIYPHVAESQLPLPHSLGVTDKPVDLPAAPLKRFLIFDKSGNQTRLFCSPFSLENRVIPSNIPATGNVYYDNLATQVDQHMLGKSTVEENWDENDLADGEEGEMREDSVEIDALLYSDSDDEYDDTDSEDDEVTSTGHTPFSLGEAHVKNDLLYELTEEVATSDDSPKRQRLLDGGYKKSSLVSFDSPMKQTGYGDDSESCCAGSKYYDDIDSVKGEKKVRIRDALKILEHMIPRSKNKDPFSIIDDAIAYLKTMKVEAEALGLDSYSEPPESATFSQ